MSDERQFGSKRRLQIEIDSLLDEACRKMAYTLDARPARSTFAAYVEFALREQLKRDQARLGIESRVLISEARSRFNYAIGASRTVDEVDAAPRRCENGTKLQAGKCDPLRAAECERDRANMIDPSEGGHIFGAEGPLSIGPTWCARCGARQEITAPGTTGNVTVRTGAEALAVMPFERDPPAPLFTATTSHPDLATTPADRQFSAADDKHAAQMADLEDSDEPIV